MLCCCVYCVVMCWAAADPDTGGVVPGAVQWHVLHTPLGRHLLCGSNDIRKLHSVQPTSRNSGRGVLKRCKSTPSLPPPIPLRQ